VYPSGRIFEDPRNPETRNMSKSAIVDRRNLDFTLYELLEVDSLTRYARYAEHSRETFDGAIDLAHQIALERFLPHNRASDNNEPKLVDGRVEIIPEVKQALDALVEAGFMATLADEADGGMQLPHAISVTCDALFFGANVSTAGYTMLSRGAANLLNAHASDAQKRLYMDPIVQGRYFGTMCLSEPQAGSSLGDIRTRAELATDGSYRISGAKMWISGGDHELSENIIHLVLAKIPGGPPGVKGISLFIVPRYLVNEDGSRGTRNDVRLAGVNHKLGQRGIVNTFLKFGEAGECVGYLVGEPHRGLAQMFHMMNEARIGVGMGAVMLGYTGFLYSLQYAQERAQGRPADNKDPASPPVAIIEHADVRRMLLQQKAYVEGAFALGLYAATLVDAQHHEQDEAVRRDAGLLLDLLTPIVKAWPSDWCLKANELAIQVLGGYGYTREYPVEQLYRDNRLNPIHEGTNGIQALDLLGRKAMMQGGAALKLLMARIQPTLAEAAAIEDLKPLADTLQTHVRLCAETTAVLGAAMARGDVARALANAGHYMTLLGHTVIAWTWLRQAVVAARALAAGAAEADVAFYEGKIAACRYFLLHELPVVAHSAQLLQSLEDSVLRITAEQF
jgi:alkylation response protein AidB-like acyl-CoA dehydrogenase